jgi:hypothetical protein
LGYLRKTRLIKLLEIGLAETLLKPGWRNAATSSGTIGECRINTSEEKDSTYENECSPHFPPLLPSSLAKVAN